MILKNATFTSTNYFRQNPDGPDGTTWAGIQSRYGGPTNGLTSHDDMVIESTGTGRLSNSRAMRVRCTYGFPSTGGGSGNGNVYRTELISDWQRNQLEGWIAISLKLDNIDSKNETYYQLHAGDTNGSPLLTIRMVGSEDPDGTIPRGFGGYLRLSTGNVGIRNTSFVFQQTPTLGVWHDIAIKYRLHPDNGEVKVWYNRNLIWQRVGQRTLSSDNRNWTPYHKVGIYKSDWGSGPSSTSVRIHRFDAFKIANLQSTDQQIFEQLHPEGLRALSGISYPTTQYTVNVNSNISNAGILAGQGTYTVGQTVNLSAIPTAGFTFVEWRLNGQTVSTNNNYSFTMQNENVTALAVFETALAPDNLIYPIKSLIV